MKRKKREPPFAAAMAASALVFIATFIGGAQTDNIDEFVDTLLDEWGTVFTYNWKLCVCAIFGLIMTIVMPILGIAWCCMHRRGRWGGGSTEYKTNWKSSVLRQVSLSFYFALWALSLWGLVWHFVADQLMADGFRDLPDHINIIVDDLQLYLNNTNAQVEHWNSVNFDRELTPGFANAVDNMAWGMEDALYEINEPEYTGMNRITGLPEFLLKQCALFEGREKSIIGDLLTELHSHAEPLDAMYNELKTSDTKWENVLSNCHPKCERIQNLAATLIYDIGLVAYPDEVSSIEVTQDDVDTINRMWDITRVFEDELARLGENFVRDNSDIIDEGLDGMRNYFEAGYRELQVVASELIFEDPGVADDAEELFEVYFNLAYYLFLIPAVFMTIILFVYLVGYFIGIFSKVGGKARTNYAANFVYSGTLMFFIFSFVFWLMTTLLFVSGTAIQKLYCDTLEEPADSEMYDMFEEEINEALQKALNNTGFDDTQWSIPDMIDSCEQGKSLYEILHLDDAYDVDSLRAWRSYVDVQRIENKLLARLNFTVYDVAEELVFPDNGIREDMLALQDKLILIIDDYLDDFMDYVFEDVIRASTLGNLTEALEDLKSISTDSEVITNIDYFLGILADMIAALPEFEKQYWTVSLQAHIYDEVVTYTTISVFEVIDDAFDVWGAVSKDQLIDNKDILEDELLEDYEDCVALFDWFADYSERYIGDDMGECSDAFDIYEAAINYSCNQLVDPLNSVWSGMGLILVAFIPMTLCAIKVETNFRSYLPENLTSFGLNWKDEIRDDASQEESVEKVEMGRMDSSESSDNSMSKEMVEVKM